MARVAKVFMLKDGAPKTLFKMPSVGCLTRCSHASINLCISKALFFKTAPLRMLKSKKNPDLPGLFKTRCAICQIFGRRQLPTGGGQGPEYGGGGLGRK